MQDLKQTTAATLTTLAPSAGGLPDGLAEKIAGADVLIILASSEQQDRALSVESILASPEFKPGHVASHAYAFAIQQEHEQLLRRVRGEPTDGQRYRAFRELAGMQDANPGRYKAVTEMLERFEDDNVKDSEKEGPELADRIADFLVHALAETAALVAEEQPATN